MRWCGESWCVTKLCVKDGGVKDANGQRVDSALNLMRKRCFVEQNF